MSFERIYNFSSGPAMLPVPVLEEMQRDLVALPGVGMSILEISHRSKLFEAILAHIKEAKKVGTVNVAASTKGEGYTRIPGQTELKLTPGAAYVHMTSNNTIEGTEYKRLPDVGAAPLIADTSSDMFSRPLEVSRYALIYSGAQKNMGPAGVTIVIIRDDLVARSAGRKSSLPTMMSYAVHAENNSLYNTPPAFAVYALGLVMKWLVRAGGAAAA